MNPFLAINANGFGVTRGVTLSLEVNTVRDLLPAGLELGTQNLTGAENHPVVLFFHDLSGAGFSLPSFFPKQAYHEFALCVPHVHLSRHSITPGHSGPYLFMPRLFLDNLWPTLTGVLGWGFAKRMAAIDVTQHSYAVSNSAGHVLSLSWEAAEEGGYYNPISAFPQFGPIRSILDQPLISMVPAGVGPFFVVSNFERHWGLAELRPIRTALKVYFDFATGFPPGRYPADGLSEGIYKDPLGSYELRAPWRLSLPYHPLISFRPLTAFSSR
jgi:hypothetical protein